MPVVKEYQRYQVIEQYEKKNKPHVRVKIPCMKCGGSGTISAFYHIFNGECFDCNGRGYSTKELRMYTDAELAKLEEARKKREATKFAKAEAERIAKIPEVNEKIALDYGFKGDYIYPVVGNTYAIREELKEAGAIFRRPIGWLFQEPTDLYPTCTLSRKEAFILPDGDDYIEPVECLEDIVQSKKLAMTVAVESNYIGTVGSKISIVVSIEMIFHVDSIYGPSYIHKMKDASGNIFIWKTSKSLNGGTKYNLTGTVKEHNEYKSEKQTTLTRCKYMEVLHEN